MEYPTDSIHSNVRNESRLGDSFRPSIDENEADITASHMMQQAGPVRREIGNAQIANEQVREVRAVFEADNKWRIAREKLRRFWAWYFHG
jgi:hypothetical protein